MQEYREAVIVGGGIIGAAALYYLAENGCERPLLLERETLASGSTGHCAGGVRTLFSDELNVQIGLESIRRPQRLEAEIGAALDLREWGAPPRVSSRRHPLIPADGMPPAGVELAARLSAPPAPSCGSLGSVGSISGRPLW